MPSPKSRCPTSTAAAAAQTANSPAANHSGHQWSLPNGRICWPQPIGDSQAGQALRSHNPLGSVYPAMLPTPLVRNASPRTPAAIPLAPRVLALSWLATAATPANTTPTAATAAPAANDPATGCPAPINARPTSTARTTFAATVT